VGGFYLEKVFPYKTMSWIRRLILWSKTCETMKNLECRMGNVSHSIVLSLTLLYIVIARSVSDVPAHRSALLWHAGVAISERDSFASLGMTNGRLFVGQYTSLLCKSVFFQEGVESGA
jgi:hypothetical protein